MPVITDTMRAAVTMKRLMSAGSFFAVILVVPVIGGVLLVQFALFVQGQYLVGMAARPEGYLIIQHIGHEEMIDEFFGHLLAVPFAVGELEKLKLSHLEQIRRLGDFRALGAFLPIRADERLKESRHSDSFADETSTPGGYCGIRLKVRRPNEHISL